MDITKTINVPAGHYVVGVSGGVDSMTLLDMLVKLGQRADKTQPLTFTMAHFDHGIREDSREDRLLVERTAKLLGLPFVYAEGKLGTGTSEDVARKARYEFLRKVKEQTEADGIITAHHQDDAIETAVHNILRGTGRKGMSSLQSTDGILRPVLHLPKKQLRNYALRENLEWREDSTNNNLAYRRNYIRHELLPKLHAASPAAYEQLKRRIRRQQEINHAIDNQLAAFLHRQPAVTVLSRLDITMLPHSVAKELVAHWLRLNGQHQFSSKLLERLTVALKTAKPRTVVEIDSKNRVHFDAKHASLQSRVGGKLASRLPLHSV